jgi:hypothetical protein
MLLGSGDEIEHEMVGHRGLDGNIQNVYKTLVGRPKRIYLRETGEGGRITISLKYV